MLTKDKIIEEALNLFSIKGFHTVTVDEIAKAVGIKAPSLYKHYKNKQCIFDAILEEMQYRYMQQMNQLQMNGMDPTSDSLMFETIAEEQLLQIGHILFSYFLHDDYTRKFRKMLIIEQFHKDEISALYINQYFDSPLSFQEKIFASLIKVNLMKEYDSQVIALHFYAPIHYLIALCDAQPEREVEALRLLDKHIQQFNQLYRVGGSEHAE